ncbi:hypothetical protein LTR62_005861 [Meristemomyces frigidus]|uniref:NUC153 domain-containing protein n=1 Tax=Meristemomyces frigidus TaxID=1508187 RepID=A0AAN7TVW3_9PEZI|nr:hypothetical protein LTR62_005861 [Meristemomyces frigidus]
MADPRFAALSKDPRYRLPSKKEARTTVDPRFASLFSDKSFRRKATVDRYGRKVEADEGRKDLERLYRLDTDGKPAKTSKELEREVGGGGEGDEDESSGEESLEEEEVAVKKRDPARDGGFSESEQESSEEAEDSEEEAELAEETAGQEQTENIPDGEVSRRIAAVNLDWDNLRAMDIMAVAASFVPSSGRIQRVSVYPSEFGRERLEREELEGPPKEIFASSKDTAEEEEEEEEEEEDEGEAEEDESEDEEDENERIKRDLIREQADDGQEFNTAALRQYQLERLRYYYAVIECDNKSTAKHLYDAMDGREYLTTANFFDLRFIPDSTSFDSDKPREDCTALPAGYKPNEFRTEALTHSKVRLTWDDDDTTRKEVQKRAFSRAELDENDLQAYIGSEESDADSTTSRKSAAEDRKARKADEKRKMMRERLGLAGESAAKVTGGKSGKKDEVVGDMVVTFTSGLSKGGKKEGVFVNEPMDEESTRARYVRKEKERKQARKERSKGRNAVGSDHDVPSTSAGAVDVVVQDTAEDAGFDDPFFNDPAAAATAEKKAHKAEKQLKRDAKAAKEAEAATKRKELELLMAEDQGDVVRHFDMREIEKAEKRKGKKGRKDKRNKMGVDDAGEDADGGAGKAAFAVDPSDDRFGALFESHEFAIDPSNPKFKGTEGMKSLLEEGRRRKRKRGGEDDGGEGAVDKAGVKIKSKEGGRDEIQGLVARLKEGKKKR